MKRPPKRQNEGYFKDSKKIDEVKYSGLEGDAYYERARKYLPKGSCCVISIVIKGGKEAAVKFMDGLKLASNEVHVADIRTCVLHPASATHRQLTDERNSILKLRWQRMRS